VPFGNDVAVPGIAEGCEGEGDRDRYRLLADSDSEGVDRLVDPLFDP